MFREKKFYKIFWFLVVMNENNKKDRKINYIMVSNSQLQTQAEKDLIAAYEILLNIDFLIAFFTFLMCAK